VEGGNEVTPERISKFSTQCRGEGEKKERPEKNEGANTQFTNWPGERDTWRQNRGFLEKT